MNVEPELLMTLRALPPEKQSEVLDFARFIQQRTPLEQHQRPVDPSEAQNTSRTLADEFADLRTLAAGDPDPLPDPDRTYSERPNTFLEDSGKQEFS